MSWRDQLRDGSFRGVPFKIDGVARTEVGRRGQLHEYPLRDTPYAEDLGRRRRAFNVECLVLGPDYMAARDALIAALEQKGAGTLVHPYYGTLSVVVFDPAQVEESTKEGGMARFRIPFMESGEKLEPATTTDTAATVNAQAANAQSQLVSSFSNGQYSMTGVPSWVSNSALSDLGDLTAQLQSLRDGIPGIPDSVTAFNTLLQGFTGTLSSLIETPFNLGASIMGLVVGLGTMAQQPLDALSLYQQLSLFGSSYPSLGTSTPARAQQASNRAALVSLVQGLAVATAAAASAAVPSQTQVIELPASVSGMAVASNGTTSSSTTVASNGTASSSTPVLIAPADVDAAALNTVTSTNGYDTADAAASTRDALTSTIDSQCLTADDNVYPALRDLRAAVVNDLNTRAATLPSLLTVTPVKTEAALVLAWRLYADATRDAEIVARNDVIYPGFVTGGQPLEVLSD
jgi:prophage DNA circulation protein